MSTHYEILGITQSASTADVTLAYRRKMREAHPDVAGDAATALAQHINEAYEVLRDDRARREYDLSLLGGGGAWQPYTDPAEPKPATQTATPDGERAGPHRQHPRTPDSVIMRPLWATLSIRPWQIAAGLVLTSLVAGAWIVAANAIAGRAWTDNMPGLIPAFMVLPVAGWLISLSSRWFWQTVGFVMQLAPLALIPAAPSLGWTEARPVLIVSAATGLALLWLRLLVSVVKQSLRDRDTARQFRHYIDGDARRHCTVLQIINTNIKAGSSRVTLRPLGRPDERFEATLTGYWHRGGWVVLDDSDAVIARFTARDYAIQDRFYRPVL